MNHFVNLKFGHINYKMCLYVYFFLASKIFLHFLEFIACDTIGVNLC